MGQEDGSQEPFTFISRAPSRRSGRPGPCVLAPLAPAPPLTKGCSLQGGAAWPPGSPQFSVAQPLRTFQQHPELPQLAFT